MALPPRTRQWASSRSADGKSPTRSPPDGVPPPPFDPLWEPLEGGGIGATMPRRARSWKWKGGAVREWREGARCQAGAMLPVLDPRAWAEVCRRRGPIQPRELAALRRFWRLSPAPPVAMEQPTAVHLADDSDWTQGIWRGLTAEAMMREDLWRFGPPRGGETGRTMRTDGAEEDGGQRRQPRNQDRKSHPHACVEFRRGSSAARSRIASLRRAESRTHGVAF